MGAASGRVDALVFMVGLLAGIWVFAEAYTWLAGFVWSGQLEDRTFTEMLGAPFWLLAALVVMMAFGMYWLVHKVERPVVGGE